MSLPPNLVRQLGKIMLQWSPLWLATTAVTTALGFAYIALVKEDVWVASQAMIVRDEIGGTLNRQGRFDNKESLKAALDTIAEIARNPQVVQQALMTQLPPDAEPLTEKDINGFVGSQLTVRSPKGSEFGTTEIFYIDVRHNDKSKAIDLNKAICDSLEKRLQDIRMSRYDGIERELEYALDIAKEQRTIATEQLKKIENDVGDNLTDLRSLTDSPSAGGTAKLQLDQLTGERRQVEVANRQLQEDLRFLQTLENDPSRVLVAPSNILNSQPGLKRLCEGLVDSQIQALQLSGRLTDNHPAIQAAQISRDAIRQQLGIELRLARTALEAEIKVSEQRLSSLDAQIQKGQTKISELAGIRADYANILGEVRNRSTIIEQIERDLAIAEANRRAAGQSSLVTRIDAPVLGDKPIGPGNKTILLASVMAGFLSGIGLILLLAPIDLGIKHGRRWSDQIFAANQSMARTPESQPIAQPLAPSPLVASATSLSASATSQSSHAPTQPGAVDRFASLMESAREHAKAAIQHMTAQHVTAAASPASSAPTTSPATEQGDTTAEANSTSPRKTLIKPRSTKPSANPASGSTHNPATSPTTSSLPASEFVAGPLSPGTRLSSLATEIEPAQALQTAAAENSSSLPSDLQPVSSNVSASNAEQAASPKPKQKPRRVATDESPADSQSEDRRSRPRQPPAAIFTNDPDSPFGFSDPSKMAT